MPTLSPPSSAVPPVQLRAGLVWTPRSAADLLRAQLAALDAWHALRRVEGAGTPPHVGSRETRLDTARRLEVREREQQALQARAAAQCREPALVLAGDRPRAVVAHRNPWYRDKVAERLAERGVDVLASVEDGAEAMAAIILDQPELLLLEDLLPTLSGTGVLARARILAAGTASVAVAMSQHDLVRLQAAGARAVFTRTARPHDVADALVECLSGVPSQAGPA